MAYEMRDMSGSAFKNRNPRDDKSAQLTGSALIFGRECWVNVWTKKDKNGDTWISFSFKEKQGKPDSAPAISSDVNDEVPF